jgi:hypothetical protein
VGSPANQPSIRERRLVVTGKAAVRAEIGRRLRERYEVGSRAIPERLALFVARIEHSESQSEQPRDGWNSMSKRDEYLANAEECERLSEIAHDSDERAAWLQMAQQWRRWAKGRPGDPGFTGKS